MEPYLILPIGALIASVFASVFLDVSETFKIRNEVILDVVGFFGEIDHQFQDFHVYRSTEIADRLLDISDEDCRSLGSALSVLLSSTSIHKKMAIGFRKKEELGLFLELNNQLRKVASILSGATQSAGTKEGQQVKQLFKDKIDPLRHNLMIGLMAGAKFNGILFDTYKVRMPTFYKIATIFKKPKN